MARPLEFTDEVVSKLEQAFAMDASVSEACFYADISRTSYYENIEKQPELANRFEELRNKPILLARQTLIKSLSEPEHAKWYLSRKRKMEFSERTETDITTDNKPITVGIDIIAVANKAAEDLKKLKTE